ncbi:MAG: hypothetical protein WDW38_009663, partial [Sanguina aurantia]
MTVARVDLTWGPIEYHRATLDNLAAAMKRVRRLCAVMVDTLGREIMVRRPFSLNEFGWPVHETAFAVKVNGRDIICRALNNAHLNGLLTVFNVERSDHELASMQNTLPILSDYDKECLTQLAREYEIDFVALSYCRSGADVRESRAVLDKCGLSSAQIVAKVETRLAIFNFKGILEAADGIVISRGTLGLDCLPEKMAMIQKTLIARSNVVGKPVLITRALDSMGEAPRPTRAEATDVANGIMDGADGLVLGSETLRGLFPVECVRTAAKIAQQAERAFDYRGNFDYLDAAAIELQHAKDKGQLSDDEEFDDTSETRAQVMPFPSPALDASMQNLSDYLTDYQAEEAAAVVQSTQQHHEDDYHSGGGGSGSGGSGSGGSGHLGDGHAGPGAGGSVHFGGVRFPVPQGSSSSDGSPRMANRFGLAGRGRGGGHGDAPACDLALGCRQGSETPSGYGTPFLTARAQDPGPGSGAPHTGEFHQPRSVLRHERELRARSPAADSTESSDVGKDVSFDAAAREPNAHTQLVYFEEQQGQPGQQQRNQQQQNQQQQQRSQQQQGQGSSVLSSEGSRRMHPSALRPANSTGLRSSLRHTPGHVHHASAVSEDSVSVGQGRQRQKSQSFADLNTAIAAMGSFGSGCGGTSVRLSHAGFEPGRRAPHRSRSSRSLGRKSGMSVVLQRLDPNPYIGTPYLSKLETIASSAVRVAEKVKASLIVVFTHTSTAAQLVAKYRPPMPILTLVVPRLVSNGLKWTLEGRSYARQCLLTRGLLPMLTAPSPSHDEVLEEAISTAVKLGLAAPHDHVVCVERIHDSFCVKVVAVDELGLGIERNLDAGDYTTTTAMARAMIAASPVIGKTSLVAAIQDQGAVCTRRPALMPAPPLQHAWQGMTASPASGVADTAFPLPKLFWHAGSGSTHGGPLARTGSETEDWLLSGSTPFQRAPDQAFWQNSPSDAATAHHTPLAPYQQGAGAAQLGHGLPPVQEQQVAQQQQQVSQQQQQLQAFQPQQQQQQQQQTSGSQQLVPPTMPGAPMAGMATGALTGNGATLVGPRMMTARRTSSGLQPSMLLPSTPETCTLTNNSSSSSSQLNPAPHSVLWGTPSVSPRAPSLAAQHGAWTGAPGDDGFGGQGTPFAPGMASHTLHAAASAAAAAAAAAAAPPRNPRRSTAPAVPVSPGTRAALTQDIDVRRFQYSRQAGSRLSSPPSGNQVPLSGTPMPHSSMLYAHGGGLTAPVDMSGVYGVHGPPVMNNIGPVGGAAAALHPDGWGAV